MKSFFTIAAFLTLVLGIGWLVFPEVMFSRWGASPDAIATYMGRRYGALLLGYTVILWHSRSASPSAALHAILAGGAVVTVMIAILSIVGALTVAATPGMWITATVEALLAAGFLYHFVASPAVPRGREERAGSAG